MRTPPHSTFWAWFYSILFFLQMGWPGWAGAAAGAVFFLIARRLPGAGDANVVYGIGIGLFLISLIRECRCRPVFANPPRIETGASFWFHRGLYFGFCDGRFHCWKDDPYSKEGGPNIADSQNQTRHTE